MEIEFEGYDVKIENFLWEITSSLTVHILSKKKTLLNNTSYLNKYYFCGDMQGMLNRMRYALFVKRQCKQKLELVIQRSETQKQQNIIAF